MFRIRSLRLVNFRGILDRLAEEAGDDRAPDGGRDFEDRFARCWQRSPLFDIGPQAPDLRQDRSRRSGGVFHAYEQEAASARALPEGAPCREGEEEQVAAELSLDRGLTPAELRRRRRDFARSHHPDRVPECFRERATRRMSIANALIDSALAGRPAS